MYVNDLRSDNDASLDLVPRITTFEQLKDIFKLDIDHSLGRDAAANGQLYWAIVGFYIRTGIASFIPKVFGESGQPVPSPGALVFAHWPSAPDFPDIPNPNYHNNAVAGFTNADGDVGFPYGGGAVVGGDGGVYDIWVSADPPTGTRFFSDMATKLGWFGGTDHLTPNPIFQAIIKQNGLPPTGESRLVVYDQFGNRVGYTPLINGQGNNGRIALEVGNQEVSYVELTGI